MIMELPLRCRYWSILQVVIIVTCHRWKVSSERAQGCVGSQLGLRCQEMKVINIIAVDLGDSTCNEASCCIRDNDCIHSPNANHRADVRRKCDHEQHCTVTVFKEKIPCGYWKAWAVKLFWSYNDFERITYDCIDATRNRTMNNNSTYEESTEDDNSTDSDSGYNKDFGTEITHICYGSQLSLKCLERKVIEVTHVVLGNFYGDSSVCNISDATCIRTANASQTMEVYGRCNGQNNCTVDVLKEDISCGNFGSSSLNVFELIAYNCQSNSQNNLTTTDGTVTNISSTTVAGISNSHMLTIVLVITCPIALLAIILGVVIMHRRKKGEPMKTRLDPVAMTEVDNNCQNEYDVCADETQGTSLHDDNYVQPLYSQIEESDSPKRRKNQIIYSEVELRGAIWKDGEKTGETKAAAVESSTQPQTRTVSKPSSPQDDGCQIVIENDLYGMADNCVKDTAVESPTRSLAGAVSKTPSPQDDEGLTVIENDIYCH